MQSDKDALDWLTTSAIKGNADAQNQLGVCYEKGQAVDQDYKKAVEWYTKAILQDHTTAQINLGLCIKSLGGATKTQSNPICSTERDVDFREL